MAGTIDNPYFCGRDICEVFGYEAPKFTLQTYVAACPPTEGSNFSMLIDIFI
jgi:prophage antirepressor-like protein